MGDKINLKLDIREQRGKKVAKLRSAGIVPGVMYGHGFDPILVQAEYNVIDKAVREAGKHTPVHVTVDGKQRITLIKDIDRNPINARLRHVSFHAVKANEVVHARCQFTLLVRVRVKPKRPDSSCFKQLKWLRLKRSQPTFPRRLRYLS